MKDVYDIAHERERSGFSDSRVERGRLIDLYGAAAVNLYGAIPLDIFCKIFNSHGKEPLEVEEAANVLKGQAGREYILIEDTLAYAAGEDVAKLVETLEKQTAGKPRYVPNSREAFLEHLDLYYTEIPEVLEKIRALFERVLKNKTEANLFMGEFMQMLRLDYPLQEFAGLADSYEMVFERPEDGEQYFALVIEAKNNSRIWANKGFTPREMAVLRSQHQF